MKTVLFLCTGNSCRSQMAEGWAKKFWNDKLVAYSAGIEARGLDPYAVQVMTEECIDIADHRSKTIADLPITTFDLVFTLCGDAAETCPIFFGARVVHHGFDDPPKLAQNAKNEAEALDCYRKVRNEIASFVAGLSLSYPELFNKK